MERKIIYLIMLITLCNSHTFSQIIYLKNQTLTPFAGSYCRYENDFQQINKNSILGFSENSSNRNKPVSKNGTVTFEKIRYSPFKNSKNGKYYNDTIKLKLTYFDFSNIKSKKEFLRYVKKNKGFIKDCFLYDFNFQLLGKKSKKKFEGYTTYTINNKLIFEDCYFSKSIKDSNILEFVKPLIIRNCTFDEFGYNYYSFKTSKDYLFKDSVSILNSNLINFRLKGLFEGPTIFQLGILSRVDLSSSWFYKNTSFSLFNSDANQYRINLLNQIQDNKNSNTSNNPYSIKFDNYLHLNNTFYPCDTVNFQIFTSDAISIDLSNSILHPNKKIIINSGFYMGENVNRKIYFDGSHIQGGLIFTNHVDSLYFTETIFYPESSIKSLKIDMFKIFTPRQLSNIKWQFDDFQGYSVSDNINLENRNNFYDRLETYVSDSLQSSPNVKNDCLSIIDYQRYLSKKEYHLKRMKTMPIIDNVIYAGHFFTFIAYSILEETVNFGYNGTNKFLTFSINIVLLFSIIYFLQFKSSVTNYATNEAILSIDESTNGFKWHKVFNYIIKNLLAIFRIFIKKDSFINFIKCFWFSFVVFINPKFSNKYFKFSNNLLMWILAEWAIGVGLMALFLIFIASKYPFVSKLLGV